MPVSMQVGLRLTGCQFCLPLLSCVALGKLLTLPGLLCPNCKMEEMLATLKVAEELC